MRENGGDFFLGVGGRVVESHLCHDKNWLQSKGVTATIKRIFQLKYVFFERVGKTH